MLFLGRKKNWRTQRKISQNKGEKLTPHNIMVLMPEFEPGPHWWKASALTTAPTSLLGGEGGAVVLSLSFSPLAPELPSELSHML